MACAAGSRVQATFHQRSEPSERSEHGKLPGKWGVGLLLAGAVSALELARRAAARDLGRGIVAGMSGTLAITTASTIDQLVTEAVHARKENRAAHLELGKAILSPWSFSAGVVSKVFGITFKDAEHERRISILAHWGYGGSWGLALAPLRALGVRGIGAMGAVLAGQLGAEMVVMPAFRLFSPPTQWGRRAIVSSIYQHMIYALAAVVVFEGLQPALDERNK